MNVEQPFLRHTWMQNLKQKILRFSHPHSWLFYKLFYSDLSETKASTSWPCDCLLPASFSVDSAFSKPHQNHVVLAYPGMLITVTTWMIKQFFQAQFPNNFLFVLCFKSLSSFLLCLKHPYPLRSNSLSVMLASLSLPPQSELSIYCQTEAQKIDCGDFHSFLLYLIQSFMVVSFQHLGTCWWFLYVSILTSFQLSIPYRQSSNYCTM